MDVCSLALIAWKSICLYSASYCIMQENNDKWFADFLSHNAMAATVEWLSQISKYIKHV